MTAVYIVNGLLIATSLAVVVTGLWDRKFGSAVGGSDVFWISIRAGQTVGIAAIVVVAVLYELGHHPHHRLFYLYTVLPAAIGLLSEDIRNQALRATLRENDLERAGDIHSLPEGRRAIVTRELTQRQVQISQVAAIVVALLALRALTTVAGV